MSKTTDARDVTWSRVDSLFYVATHAGSFLGTVDGQDRGVFVARNAHGRHINDFATLEQAQTAILDQPSTRRPVEETAAVP